MMLLLAALLQAGGGSTHPRGDLVARIQFESRTYAVAVSPWNVVYVTQPDVGGRPRRIGFDRSGTTAVLANEAGWVDILR